MRIRVSCFAFIAFMLSTQVVHAAHLFGRT